MKVYDIIEEAIDVRLMDAPNITSIILDYIQTSIFYFQYEETDYEHSDLEEINFISKACILATNEDEAYEMFKSHTEGLKIEQIDKDTFIGNLTLEENKRYFTLPKIYHIYTVKKGYGLDRKFSPIYYTWGKYEYKHKKGEVQSSIKSKNYQDSSFFLKGPWKLFFD